MNIQYYISTNDGLAQFSWNETNMVVNQKLESDILINMALAITSLFIISVNSSVIYWMVNKVGMIKDSKKI